MHAPIAITGRESADDLERICRMASIDSIGFTKQALLVFIDRFLAGELLAEELERIAEVLDVNDAIEVPAPERQAVIDAVFSLSSTEINGKLDMQRVEALRAELLG